MIDGHNPFNPFRHKRLNFSTASQSAVVRYPQKVTLVTFALLLHVAPV
jgi:hypothetical protein